MLNIEILKQIAIEAGELIRHAHVENKDISSKSGHQNFVTIYDEKVQNFLEKRLAEAFPSYAFFGEENDKQVVDPASAKAFIVDPIDGTSNFIYQVPMVAICIAAVNAGTVEMSLVYNPFLNEMFTAEKGKGAYLNGQSLRCPDWKLDEGLCGFGMSPYNAELVEETLAIASKVQKKVVDLRRLGAASLDICYVARGIQAGYFELNLQAWDYAAASLIAEEAGCIISDRNGNRLPMNSNSSCIVAGPSAYDTILEMTKKP